MNPWIIVSIVVAVLVGWFLLERFGIFSEGVPGETPKPNLESNAEEPKPLRAAFLRRERPVVVNPHLACGCIRGHCCGRGFHNSSRSQRRAHVK